MPKKRLAQIGSRCYNSLKVASSSAPEAGGRRGSRVPVAPTEPSDLELPASPSPGREVPRRRMNSFLLLSTVVASVALSVALGALVLRVALKLLARNLAK